MYHVYILKSLKKKDKPDKNHKTYVGLTVKDINIRLKEHNTGLSQYTKTDKPWKLIYFENFYCKLCAEKREQFLKSGFGYRFRSLIANNYQSLIKTDSALQKDP